MTNLFNDPRGPRGGYLFMMQMHEIYAIVNKRLQSTQGRTNFDIDAVCQSICVEIEKHQGIYPNVVKRSGECSGSPCADDEPGEHQVVLDAIEAHNSGEEE